MEENKELEEQVEATLQIALSKEKEAEEAEQRSASEALEIRKRIAAATKRRFNAELEVNNLRIQEAEERIKIAKNKEEIALKVLEITKEDEKDIDLVKLRAEKLENEAHEAEPQASVTEKRAADIANSIRPWRHYSGQTSEFDPYPDPFYAQEREKDIRRRQEIKTLKVSSKLT